MLILNIGELSMEKEKFLTKELTIYLAEFIVLIISMAGMFFWSISESKEDKRILFAMINENRIETQSTLNAIHAEMKDFHGRLCAIEEKNREK
jgi:hypothetical protein